MTIGIDDFLSWKNEPVTKAYLEAIKLRIEEATEELVANAGEDSSRDSFLRGFIFAYKELQDFKVEGVD